MKPIDCSQEASVTRAVRTGAWDESLKAHASACPVCGELMKTARWMQVLAGESAGVHSPRAASLIWLRARLSEQQTRADKAQAIGEWAETLSVATALAAVAAWGAWNWPFIEGWMSRLVASAELWVATNSTPMLQLSVMAGVFLALAVLASPILLDE